MSISSKAIPEHIAKLMPATVRKELGKGAMTSEEALLACGANVEREMHNTFSTWLKLNEIFFIHARTDKKSTIAEHWPDFTVIHKGRCLLIEFKMPGRGLDEGQKQLMIKLNQEGTHAYLFYSVKDAIGGVRREFGL